MLMMAAATQPSRAGFNQGMSSSGLCLWSDFGAPTAQWPPTLLSKWRVWQVRRWSARVLPDATASRVARLAASALRIGKQATDLLRQPRKCWFVLEKQVIATLQRHEASPGNQPREQTTLLERRYRIVAHVQHNRGASNPLRGVAQ